jgi:aspartyl protease family protein
MIDNGPSLIWGIAGIIMVVSSLTARRLPLSQMLKMALAWIAIFAGLFVAFSFRPEITAVWSRLKADLNGTANQSVSADTIKLTRRDDGHFWLKVDVNGRPTEFMIDSGATITSMNTASAREANVDVDMGGFPVILDTANGQVSAKRGFINVLSVDAFMMNEHHVVVANNFGDTNVLGMNFLDSLRSWKVEESAMTLQP